MRKTWHNTEGIDFLIFIQKKKKINISRLCVKHKRIWVKFTFDNKQKSERRRLSSEGTAAVSTHAKQQKNKQNKPCVGTAVFKRQKMSIDTVSKSTKCVCIEMSVFLTTLADGQGKRQNLQSQLQIFICSGRLFQLGIFTHWYKSQNKNCDSVLATRLCVTHSLWG